MVLCLLQNNVETVYKKVVNVKDITIQKSCGPHRIRCGLCGGPSGSFQLYHNELELEMKDSSLNGIDPSIKEKVKFAMDIELPIHDRKFLVHPHILPCILFIDSLVNAFMICANETGFRVIV